MALPACRERPLERLADLYTGLLHGADLSPSDEAVSVILLSALQRKWRNALVKKRLEEWRRSKVRLICLVRAGDRKVRLDCLVCAGDRKEVAPSGMPETVVATCSATQGGLGCCMCHPFGGDLCLGLGEGGMPGEVAAWPVVARSQHPLLCKVAPPTCLDRDHRHAASSREAVGAGCNVAARV